MRKVVAGLATAGLLMTGASTAVAESTSETTANDGTWAVSHLDAEANGTWSYPVNNRYQVTGTITNTGSSCYYVRYSAADVVPQVSRSEKQCGPGSLSIDISGHPGFSISSPRVKLCRESDDDCGPSVALWSGR